MARKAGDYYYAPHRGMWGIWLCKDLGDGIQSGEFLKDCITKEEAKEMVYSLNGWSK